MYRKIYFLGQTVRYKGTTHKITAVRFTAGGIMYKLDNIKEWIRGSEI